MHAAAPLPRGVDEDLLGVVGGEQLREPRDPLRVRLAFALRVEHLRLLELGLRRWDEKALRLDELAIDDTARCKLSRAADAVARAAL